METLIAVPTWVLYFGMVNVMLTVINVVLTFVLARLLSRRYIDEVSRRAVDNTLGPALAVPGLSRQESESLDNQLQRLKQYGQSMTCGCEKPSLKKLEDGSAWCIKCGGDR